MLHSDDVLRKSYGKIYADNGLGASYGEFSDLLKSTDGMKIAEALEKLSDFVPGR
ncbi:MAG: hypothetical protein JW793_13805 [Acidobacteria bacterium]|nr:hypothetical protein [Acidobacteriota bacterium]